MAVWGSTLGGSKYIQKIDYSKMKVKKVESYKVSIILRKKNAISFLQEDQLYSYVSLIKRHGNLLYAPF